jgi:hypothetical protein
VPSTLVATVEANASLVVGVHPINAKDYDG